MKKSIDLLTYWLRHRVQNVQRNKLPIVKSSEFYFSSTFPEGWSYSKVFYSESGQIINIDLNE